MPRNKTGIQLVHAVLAWTVLNALALGDQQTPIRQILLLDSAAFGKRLGGPAAISQVARLVIADVWRRDSRFPSRRNLRGTAGSTRAY